MALPQPLDNSFQTEIKRFEEEKTMPYVTSIERLGIEKTMRENIISILQVRFTTVPSDLVNLTNQIQDIEQLKILHRQAVTIPSLADFQQLINS
jgi:hypothetical protein